jgi:hypothetical protein
MNALLAIPVQPVWYLLVQSKLKSRKLQAQLKKIEERERAKDEVIIQMPKRV